MAGHNRWTQIKRQKAVKDAKKADAYTKMAKAIHIAVKTGGGADPNYNFKLKAAIDKAKETGMPKSNIERAIEKAAGKDSDNNLKELIYEGYLPGGVAVMIFAASDNSNRTYNDVRTTFGKAGGSLGTSGSVSYLFSKDENQEYIPLATVQIDDPEKLNIITKALDTLDDHEDILDIVTNLEV